MSFLLNQIYRTSEPSLASEFLDQQQALLFSIPSIQSEYLKHHSTIDSHQFKSFMLSHLRQDLDINLFEHDIPQLFSFLVRLESNAIARLISSAFGPLALQHALHYHPMPKNIDFLYSGWIFPDQSMITSQKCLSPSLYQYFLNLTQAPKFLHLFKSYLLQCFKTEISAQSLLNEIFYCIFDSFQTDFFSSFLNRFEAESESSQYWLPHLEFISLPDQTILNPEEFYRFLRNQHVKLYPSQN